MIGWYNYAHSVLKRKQLGKKKAKLVMRLILCFRTSSVGEGFPKAARGSLRQRGVP